MVRKEIDMANNEKEESDYATPTPRENNRDSIIELRGSANEIESLRRLETTTLAKLISK